MTNNQISVELHILFNALKKFSFPFNESQLPENGIYILFEKGEKFKKLDRIVRIGTHTGNGRFTKRLKDHFLKPNQRSSIFRKHLGRCFLSKAYDTYLRFWNLKLNKKEDKQRNKDKVNLEYEKKYEEQITKYIKDNFSFVVIPNIDNAVKRLELESALIGTIAQDTITSPSNKWLGRYHPNIKINNGKLWNLQHLFNQPLKKNSLILIQNKLKGK